MNKPTVIFLSKAAFELLPEPVCAISVGEPGEAYPANLKACMAFKDVCRLEFDDIEHDLGPEYTMFDEIHADRILGFLDRHKGEDIVVHCHAGMSRSAAIADFIATYYDYTLPLNRCTTPHLLKKNTHVAWMLHRVRSFRLAVEYNELLAQSIAASRGDTMLRD